MFRWCSYCQNLIGEAEPFSDYRVSHGICVPCSRNLESETSEADILRARSIFGMLETAGRGGSLEDCEQVIDEALAFGLKPSDMIVGILHPALCRIGELWERGEISVAAEHRFTAFALGLIDKLKYPEPDVDRPLIILANHPESMHDVGLRILQVVSWEHGIPCERILPGAGEEELLDIASTREPVTFGLSVSLVQTIPSAVTLAESLAKRLPESSQVILGGQAFRRAEGFKTPALTAVIRSIDGFLLHLRSVKDRHARAQGVA